MNRGRAIGLLLAGLLPLAGRAAPEAWRWSGEWRERYESFRHASWGAGPQDGNGFWLHRVMLGATGGLAEAWSAGVQLKSAWQNDRTGGARATDEDRLDLHQAWLDWSVQPGLRARVGRQEVAFGSSRLVSVRGSPNVRQSFDGLRATWQSGERQVDVLTLSPASTKPGEFDDGTDRDRALWGLYAVTPLAWLPGGHIDLYYLGLRRRGAVFDQGRARERRHSFGFRLWGRHADWDYNVEAVLQTGTFGDGTIFAWTLASDTGLTLPQLPGKPRLGLKADVISGDRDHRSARLGTFNALFPRGAYFNESGLIGPANLVDLHPSVQWQPTARLKATVDADFFWRESRRDGIYGPAVNLVRSGRTASARWIGWQPSATAEWQFDRRWSATATWAWFRAGAFLRETGPGRDVTYFSTWLTCRL